MTQMATPGSEWIKSSFSFANGNCVEVQFLTDGSVEVRNSRDPDGMRLTFTAGEWTAFTGGCKLGEFDLEPGPAELAALQDPDVIAAVRKARGADRAELRQRPLPDASGAQRP